MIEWELIEKSFHGLLNERETNKLNLWLNESPAHRAYYESAKLGGPTDAMLGLSEEVLNKRRRQFDQLIGQRNRSKILRKRILKYAAAIFIPILLYTGFNLLQNAASDRDKQLDFAPKYTNAVLKNSNGEQVLTGDSLQFKDILAKVTNTENSNASDKIQLNTLTIPQGGTFCAVLCDGTKVWLNSDSELTFPDKFTGATREVRLKGEAFFEVTKDKQHQFVVKTENFDLKVYGTHFNVNSYNDEPQSSLTLVEGSVSVTVGQTTQFLVPNQQFVFNKSSKNGEILDNVNIDAIEAWRHGMFNFDKETLGSIMRKLSRWYGVPYKIKDAARLANIRFVGKIVMYENASKVLDMLKLTNEIDYKLENGEIVIEPL